MIYLMFIIHIFLHEGYVCLGPEHYTTAMFMLDFVGFAMTVLAINFYGIAKLGLMLNKWCNIKNRRLELLEKQYYEKEVM
jgi:hypothetical protein